jgi:hypothetical protein
MAALGIEIEIPLLRLWSPRPELDVCLNAECGPPSSFHDHRPFLAADSDIGPSTTFGLEFIDGEARKECFMSD